jgi:hypothetical protein
MLSAHFWTCGHDTWLYITCSACVVNITMLNTEPVYCTHLVYIVTMLCKSYLSVLGTIIVTYMAHISCNFMRSACVCVCVCVLYNHLFYPVMENVHGAVSLVVKHLVGLTATSWHNGWKLISDTAPREGMQWWLGKEDQE